MRTLTCALVATALLLAGAARANPISSQILRLRQTENKTTHVQITYGTMMKDLPTAITRDGTALTPTWTPLASFSANTGSGVSTIAAQQFCDCNVPLGAHQYVAKVKEYDLKASITVVADYTPPKAADAGVGKDMMPWDQPEPTQLQGLDCETACKATPAGEGAKTDGPARSDGSQTKTDGSQTKADSGTTKPASNDGGGCSIGSRPAGASLLLLGAALLVAGLLLRRRR